MLAGDGEVRRWAGMRVALMNSVYGYKPAKKYVWWQLVVTFCYGFIAGLLWFLFLMEVLT